MRSNPTFIKQMLRSLDRQLLSTRILAFCFCLGDDLKMMANLISIELPPRPLSWPQY